MEKLVRIVLTQKVANYRKEETIDNKMTYPLPPLSTIIGAIHNACGYTEYHPMNISIQGTYGGIMKRVYYDSCFLNSLQNDRGVLVKMKNGDMLSNAFEIVAEAKKSQGNDFRKGITIQVHNENLIKEYRDLKDLADKIADDKKELYNPYIAKIKARKEEVKRLKLVYKEKKNDEKIQQIKEQEKNIILEEKEAKKKFKEYEEKYSIPISKFRTLTRGPKYYELLTDIKLILHIKAQDEVMHDIVNNIDNFTSLGRSEDFVDVKECSLVQTYDMDELDMDEVECGNSAYLDARLFINEENVFPIGAAVRNGVKKYGTRYILNKNYIIENEKRVFHKKSVIYTSNFVIDRDAVDYTTNEITNTNMPNILIDRISDNKYYVVNLL